MLVVGVPRGATTFVGEVMGRTEGATYVHEPDGTHDPFAFRAKLPVLNHPVLGPGDAAPELDRLWAGAFAGGAPARTAPDRISRRAFAAAPTAAKVRARQEGRLSPSLRVAMWGARPRVARADCTHVVVKSVNAAFAVDWIAARFAPTVCVVLRHPLNVIASQRHLGFGPPGGAQYAAVRAHALAAWGITLPDEGAAPLARSAALAASMLHALEQSLGAHPEWQSLSHEAMCRDPVTSLHTLADGLGLTWTESVEDFVRASNRHGDGYATQRVASEQPARWRGSFEPDELRTVREVLRSFDGAPWRDTTPDEG